MSERAYRAFSSVFGVVVIGIIGAAVLFGIAVIVSTVLSVLIP